MKKKARGEMIENGGAIECEDDDVTTMVRDWKIDKRHFSVFVVHEMLRRGNPLREKFQGHFFAVRF